MFAYVLWLAILLLLAASIYPHKRRMLIGAVGWWVFSLHWLLQPPHYVAIADWYNVGVTLGAAVLCALLGYLMVEHYRGHTRLSQSTLLTLTAACAIGGVAYFPFAQLELLQTALEGMVAYQTVWLIAVLGHTATLVPPCNIEIQGFEIEIVLACTAIESMALFTGLILAVDAPVMRKLRALLISVPVIYLLNLFRNAFVCIATGYLWFSPDPYESFYIAHAVLAKVGSTLALIVIAYGVLKVLPELLDVIDEFVSFVMRRGRA
ncbi:MAG: archaeosortase A [Methermicoccaceae archaeon]